MAHLTSILIMLVFLTGVFPAVSYGDDTSDKTSGREVNGKPAGTDVQGNPDDRNVQGSRPKDAQGNPPQDIYGNKTGTENK
jgi:hypothetical protein